MQQNDIYEGQFRGNVLIVGKTRYGKRILCRNLQ